MSLTHGDDCLCDDCKATRYRHTLAEVRDCIQRALDSHSRGAASVTAEKIHEALGLLDDLLPAAKGGRG